MSAETLKQVIDESGKPSAEVIIEISAATKLDPTTIKRFLKTGRANRSTKTAIDGWVQKHSKDPAVKTAS